MLNDEVSDRETDAASEDGFHDEEERDQGLAEVAVNERRESVTGVSADYQRHIPDGLEQH
jgi:hypothetical protein